MPNDENGKKHVYHFDKCYENRLRTMLQGSNGLKITSIKDVRFVTTGSGEIEETIAGITICKSQLPGGCKLELVEDVLCSLEKNPDNAILLEELADYTKNHPYESQIPLWIGAGLVLGIVLFGVIPSLVCLSLIGIGWYLLNKDQEDNLMRLTRDCKIEQVVKEAIDRQTLTSPCEKKCVSQAFATYAALYPNLNPRPQNLATATNPSAPSLPSHPFFPYYPNRVTDQSTANNANDSFQQVPENRFSMK